MQSRLFCAGAILDGWSATLMRADVGSFAGEFAGEVWNGLAGFRAGAIWGELEIAGFAFAIEAGAGGVNRLAANAVRFLRGGNAAIEKIVIVIVVDVFLV